VSRVAAAVLAASLAGCSGVRNVSASASPQNTPVARAAAPADDPPDTAQLADTLRTLLLKYMPDPIVQSSHDWGHQKEYPVGGRVRDGRGEPVMEKRNDGTWRRVAVRAPDPARSLTVVIADVATPEPGKVTFTARLAVDCDIRFEQQVWKKGVRLYSGETRGRCHAAAALKCEVTTRTERPPGGFVPDLVLRVRVTEAQLSYDNLVVEHTAGLGGDAARVLGDALISTVKQAKPSLERDLLAKANAAVVKAADTREVRVSLGKLLDGKAPTVERKPAK
jgi:hypothetical protein